MVTRKPFGPPVDTTTPPKPTGNAIPPYPTTPTSGSKQTSPVLTHLDRSKTIHSAKSVYSPDLNQSPAFDLIDMNDARLQRQRRDSDVESRESWENSDDEREEGEVEDGDAVVLPKPLTVRKSYQDIGGQADEKTEAENGLPAALIPGGMQAARKSAEEMRHEDEGDGNPWAGVQSDGAGGSNNPYRQPPQQNAYTAYQPNGAVPERKPVSVAAPPPQPAAAPPLPPTAAPPAPPAELPTEPKTPADELSRLLLGEQRPQPKPFETTDILALPEQRQPSVAEADGQQAQELLSNNPWKAPSPAPQESGVPVPAEPTSSTQPQYAPPPGPPPKAAAAAPLIDHEAPPPQQAQTEAARPIPAPINTSAAAAAPQPRRESQPVPETPNTIARRQRSEHYSIKHINWLDGQTNQLRQSPILTQNANGPCPLLALVNALVLTTPQNLETALVETLRTREQISLGLLLDAVFDELMSGRRISETGELPDVGELYKFLLALHTGMNVNPRFTLQPGSGSVAGTFEQTKEMRLYSTFSIPLIHGWIAPADTPAGMAMQRNAPTFEEAQNIQFLELELEDKKGAEGLSIEEDQVLEDIRTVKRFLDTWPTQLTDFGLEEISKGMKGGETAILFRNDHFSTLYKEPRHGALMTLVTDAGYGGHDEIVWESLVDVGGSASEMFSGDFRVVSHNEQHATRLNQGNSGGGEEGWTTVQNRRQPQQQRQNAAVSQTLQQSEEVPPPLPGPRPAPAMAGIANEDLGRQTRSASEQEDHDLALALQLQEEEEANEREATERRQRETRLSEQYLSSQTQNTGNDPEGPRPPIPPRRSRFSRSGAPAGRPGVTRPPEQGGSPPPPTYEQSAHDRMYRPAGATAARADHGNPLSAYDALRRQQSGPAMSATSVNTMGSGGGRQGNRTRRRSGQMNSPGGPGGYGQQGSGPAAVSGGPSNGPVGQAAGVKDAEDKCTVM